MNKNIIFMYSTYIFNMLFPMILMPLITNNITQEEYGYYSLAYTCFTFCFILCDFSFNLTEARNIFKKNSDEINDTIKNVQFARYLLAISATIIATIYFVSIDGIANVLFYFIVTLLGLLGYVSFVSWFYVATNNMKQNTFLFVLMKLLSLISVLVSVNIFGVLDWKIVYFSSVIYYPIIGFIITFNLLKSKNIKVDFYIYPILNKMKAGLYLFITDFAPNLYNTIPIILISSYISIDKYAIFNLANRLALVVSGGLYVFLRAIYPSLCVKYNKFNAMKLMVLIVIVILSGLIINYFFGKEIISKLFGGDYVGAYKYVSVTLIGILFLGVSESIQFAYLLPNKKDKFLAKVSAVVVVSSLLFLFFSFDALKEWSIIYTLLFSRFIFMLSYVSYYILNLYSKVRNEN
ncbi:oligosaccharide flippase family protein [Photobacterium carnosum]|uniref:oligosaccharide flippase family protein n=1 Tax=Photobacterium carnosum TaxID=2023717 RepID=UPI001E318CE5|nr:oligosaccharide flippase family protein [Photobacterium carnosum]MCD9546747.1 oligosaccharide flippase family protein [Photobacterium carnosum]